MGAVDSLRRAVQVLRGKPGDLAQLGAECMGDAYASATIADHYRAHPESLTPLPPMTRTQDAAPIDWAAFAAEALERNSVTATREAMMASSWGAWRDAPQMLESGSRSPGGVTIGSQGGGAVGPTIAARLPGGASQYTIGTDGDGSTVVWKHSDIESKGDTMQTEVADRARRARTEYLNVTSRTKLAAINRRNAEFWKKSA